MPSDVPDHNAPDRPPRPTRIYGLAWTFYLVLAIAGVLWVGWSQGSIPLALFIDTAGWWTDVVLGLLGGLLLVALWDVGRRFVPAMRALEQELAEHLGPLDESEVYALALISGFAEELFFRGAVQSSWGFWWAAAIFTLMHSGPGRVFRWWTLFALVAGLVFGGLTLLRGNILAAVVAHGSVNAINLRRLAARRAAVDESSLEEEPRQRDLLDSPDADEPRPGSSDEQDSEAKESD